MSDWDWNITVNAEDQTLTIHKTITGKGSTLHYQMHFDFEEAQKLQERIHSFLERYSTKKPR